MYVNPTLLADPTFCATLETHIKNFYDINDGPDVPPVLLWDTLKVFLRWHIISNEAFRNKMNKVKLQNLEQQIEHFEKENAQNPSKELYRKILLLKYEYNKILTKMSKSFLYKYYYTNIFLNMGKNHTDYCQDNKMENGLTI